MRYFNRDQIMKKNESDEIRENSDDFISMNSFFYQSYKINQ